MSIASRITSIEGHIEEDYNALERLGADLTNVDKNIENIASVVNDIYDKLPKVTGTGSDLSLTPTLKGALGTIPLGNCEQDSYSGKNKFALANDEEKNGITFTKNNDGTFNLKGTATANTEFGIWINEVLPSGIYTLSTNTSVSGLRFFVQDYSSNEWISNMISLVGVSQNTLTLSPTGTRTRYVITIINGTQIDIKNIEIQLESGSSKTSFEKYVGRYSKP